MIVECVRHPAKSHVSLSQACLPSAALGLRGIAALPSPCAYTSAQRTLDTTPHLPQDCLQTESVLRGQITPLSLQSTACIRTHSCSRASWHQLLVTGCLGVFPGTSQLGTHVNTAAAEGEAGKHQALLWQQVGTPKEWQWQQDISWACRPAVQAEDGKSSGSTSTPTLDEQDQLQEEMEKFLRSQAEQESGG